MFSTNQYVRPAYNVRMNRVLCCIVLPYLEKKLAHVGTLM